MKAINAVDVGWLAGLFEGEGCMSLNPQGRPTIRLGMTDEDVVRKFHSIVGIGTVKAAKNPTNGGKTMWCWGTGRCEDAAWIIEQMLPHFCSRRAARARQVLESYAKVPPPKRLRTHCKYGHPFSGDNISVDMSTGTPRRVCRRCRVIAVQEYRKRYPERARESLRASRARKKAHMAGQEAMATE